MSNQIKALEAQIERLGRELSAANHDINALGVQLSRMERLGVELADGEDAWSVLDEQLAESRRVLEVTGFHEREDGAVFLCECSSCVKRDRVVDRPESEV
jgi:septal ring factor EnvC (AmiA/AmiB activator)